ncbi:hypothetical protein HID58_095803, partial [Brassica napus]
MALQYISHADETERRARIMRVQQSIEADKDNPPAVLTKISHEVDKEKGHVFQHDKPASEALPLVCKRAHPTLSAPSGDRNRGFNEGSSSGESANSRSVPKGPTVFQAGIFCSTSTGTFRNKKKKSRQRPPAWVRHVRPARSSTCVNLSAQQPDQATHMALESTNSSVDAWEKPPSEMVKCNVGMAWVDAGPVNGSSWILRDDHGQPLQHSREALTGSSSKMESDLKSLLWAVQAIGDLRYKFPELSPLILKILELLHRFEKWTISHVSDLKNRVAKSIAESVVVGIRTQSYVASGGPRWLHQMLQEDASNTCLLV